jgi:P-type conjugative transfer protein TrbG
MKTRQMTWTGLMALITAASACTTTRPAPANQPPVQVEAAAPLPQLRPPEPPPPTGADLLAAQPVEVQQAVARHQKSGKWPSFTTPGYVLYAFNPAATPVVECAPLRTTDIQLAPGETITDVALGDSERWMATPASSGDPHNPVPHLAVKPQASGIETNMTIYATAHIYHLLLRARGRAMQEVEFYYPDELLTAMKAADAAATRSPEGSAAPNDQAAALSHVAAVDPGQLNFAYEIEGPDVPWRPVRAFDDGAHVYIEVGPQMKVSEAPALMIGAAGGTQIVNYRLAGNYFVVDRLFKQALLVSGVGRAQDRVTIAYAGGAR